MTKKQKTITAVVIAVAVLLLIWLLLGRKGGQTVYQSSPLNPFNVELPAFTMPPRGGPIQVPDYGPLPEPLTAIGACCADCASTKAVTGYSTLSMQPGMTFVYNEGSKGPTIINKIVQTVAPYLGGTWYGMTSG